MTILINTEKDTGSFGSTHCAISRGRDAYTSVACDGLESIDVCETRITQ